MARQIAHGFILHLFKKCPISYPRKYTFPTTNPSVDPRQLLLLFTFNGGLGLVYNKNQNNKYSLIKHYNN